MRNQIDDLSAVHFYNANQMDDLSAVHLYNADEDRMRDGRFLVSQSSLDALLCARDTDHYGLQPTS